MPDRISLDADVISYHAPKVDRLGDDARLALDAAQSMSLTDGAFGLMCAMLVPPAMAVSTAATHAIAGVEDVLRASTRELKAGASQFATFEEQVIDEIRGLASDLDGGR